jgi:peptide/nickel transport system substrate-binding protein
MSSKKQLGGGESAPLGRNLSRRSVLVLGAAGAGVAMSAPFLAACSLGGNAGVDTGASQPPARPTGVLTVASQEPDTLDPTLSAAGVGLMVIGYNVYEALLRFRGQTSDVEPVLAETFESSPDAREWTFRIKTGIAFHDDTPLDAAAVKASYEYYRNQAGPYKLLPVGAKFEAPDPQTFKITSDTPIPDLARSATLISIISPKLLAGGAQAVKRQPTGTGPFKFVSYTAAEKVVLQANEKYRGPGPYVQQLVFAIIPDPSAQVAALRAGNIDLIHKMAPTDATPFRSLQEFSVAENPAWTTTNVVFFRSSGPSNDLRVRQAFAHAVDKDAIIKSVYSSTGKPSDSFLPPGVYGYASPSQQYPFDPARAKALIAETGLPTPVDLEIVWAPQLGSKVDRLSQALSAMVKEVGINLKVTQEPISQISKEIFDPNSKKTYQCAPGDSTWLTGGPFFITTKYLQNVAGFNAIDGVCNQILLTPDGPDRLKLLQQAQDLISTQLPVVSVYTPPVISTYKRSVKDFVLPPGLAQRYGEVYLA